MTPGNILSVVTTMRNEDLCGIISARRAIRHEQKPELRDTTPNRGCPPRKAAPTGAGARHDRGGVGGRSVVGFQRATEGDDGEALTDLSEIDFEKQSETFLKTLKPGVEQLPVMASEALDHNGEAEPNPGGADRKKGMLVDAYNAATSDLAETLGKVGAPRAA